MKQKGVLQCHVYKWPLRTIKIKLSHQMIIWLNEINSLYGTVCKSPGQFPVVGIDAMQCMQACGYC